MHLQLLPGFTSPELGQEHVGDQAVMPVPLAVPVQRDDEEAPSRGLGQPAGGAAAIQRVVAEGAGHLVESGRTHQEPYGVRRLAGEQLVAKVLRDVRVVPGEPAREGGIRRASGGTSPLPFT